MNKEITEFLGNPPKLIISYEEAEKLARVLRKSNPKKDYEIALTHMGGTSRFEIQRVETIKEVEE